VKTPKLVALCLVLNSVLLFAQATLTDEDVAKLIFRVQQTPTARLDPSLPPITFETWLQSEVGSDTVIGWAVRTADASVWRFPRVEADISIPGRPGGVVIMIAVGKQPTFKSLFLHGWATKLNGLAFVICPRR
jgi:hypothetical protein